MGYWFRKYKWVIVFGLIVLACGIFVFFRWYPPEGEISQAPPEESVMVSPPFDPEANRIERSQLPPPPDVDPQEWPEKIVYKTPEGMDRIIVRFKFGVEEPRQKEIIEQYGGRLLDGFDASPYSKSLFIPEARKADLGRDPEIFEIEDDEPKEMFLTQIVPAGVIQVQAPPAWNKKITGAGIKVAVIDSGIDLLNADFSNVDQSCSWSAFDSQNLTINSQKNSHGSLVASIVAAQNNTNGVVGVAPGATLCFFRVGDDEEKMAWSGVIRAVERAAQSGAHVVNLSLGGTSEPPELKTAIDIALAANIVVVASAGNPDQGQILYPAKYPGVIAVSNVDAANVKPSSYPNGPEISLVARGIGIFAACPPGGNRCDDQPNLSERTAYFTDGGTSSASPHVAGAVALLLTQKINPKYDANKDGQWQRGEVAKVLTDTATDLGPRGKDDAYGYGFLNIPKALAAGTAGSCTGTAPAQATLCSGDDTGLETDTPRALVNACTDTKKCEYTCASGFVPQNGSCVKKQETEEIIAPPPGSTSSGKGLVPCGRTVDDPTTAINEDAPCTICHLVLGVEGIIQWGLKVMTYIAIAVIVAMAILYIVSAGNEGLMETAKKGITASLVGFAVMLGAWLIVNTVITIFADTSDSSKPLATLRSNGAFRFTCDVQSNAGSASGVTANPGTTTSGGRGGTGAGGAACTDPVAFKNSLSQGGKVCDGTCRKGKCNFPANITAAIENNSGGADVKIVKSVVCRESTGNPNATNQKGGVTSCGLMQVNWNEVPGNTSCAGPAKNLFDPIINIQEGVRVLNKKIADQSRAAGAYSSAGVTPQQMAFAAYNCCANGDRPNDASRDCPTQEGWPSLPKWACPIKPGAGDSNMCTVKDYACDVEACAALY